MQYPLSTSNESTLYILFSALCVTIRMTPCGQVRAQVAHPVHLTLLQTSSVPRRRRETVSFCSGYCVVGEGRIRLVKVTTIPLRMPLPRKLTNCHPPAANF